MISMTLLKQTTECGMEETETEEQMTGVFGKMNILI